jgi:hypothetical protein
MTNECLVGTVSALFNAPNFDCRWVVCAWSVSDHGCGAAGLRRSFELHGTNARHSWPFLQELSQRVWEYAEDTGNRGTLTSDKAEQEGATKHSEAWVLNCIQWSRQYGAQHC